LTIKNDMIGNIKYNQQLAQRYNIRDEINHIVLNNVVKLIIRKRIEKEIKDRNSTRKSY